MKILVAPDKFKGCLDAGAVADAIAEGLEAEGLEAVRLPLADGGEGTARILAEAAGAKKVICPTVDPLLRPLTGTYYIDGETAILDVATASGMALLNELERNPTVTDTYGTGLMMADALHRGCRHFIIGLGGSATVDGGTGMIKALMPDGKSLVGMDDATFTLLTDVDAPLCGPRGAARVFGPQKGATPADTEALEQKLHALACRMGVNPDMPGLGAAGGFGLMLAGLYGAATKIMSGAEYVLDHSGFDNAVRECVAVITGEGHIDSQTLMGKLPFEVMKRAHHNGTHIVAAFCGKVDDRTQLLEAGFSCVNEIHSPGLSQREAMNPGITRRDLAFTAHRWASQQINDAAR